MKSLTLLLITLLLASCASGVKKKQIETTETPSQISLEPSVMANVFSVKSNLKYMIKLADVSNCVIKKESFASDLLKIESFDYSDANGETVYNDLINHRSTLRTYRSKNPFSSVNAMTLKSKKHEIYFNRKNNPRSMKEMVRTSVHELSHNAGYSHGDNTTRGKENSVPWTVGRIAAENLEGCL